MDSNPTTAQGQAASTQPSNETTLPNTTPSQTQAATSGFLSFHTDLAAGLFECVNQAARIDEETRRIIHVPAGRRLITEGFEILATMHGTLFAMMCDQWNYDRDSFYDHVTAYVRQQRADYNMLEMARAAGMSLEDFKAKLNSEGKPNA